MTDRQSFNELSNYINFLINQIEHIKICIIGTKTDLVHIKVVSTDEAIEFARRQHCSLFEVSSLSSRFVERAFDSFMEEIIANIKAKGILPSKVRLPSYDKLIQKARK